MLRSIATALALLIATTAHAETFAIQAGHLIVDASAPARGPSTIIVENGRIARIEPGVTAPASATVVDLHDKTVLPGLIDAHVHLTQDSGLPWYVPLRTRYSEPFAATTGLKNALITARAGFTTVRDAGGPMLASMAIRDAIDDGDFPGPRILAAGTPLSIVGGHGDDVVGLKPEIADAINKAQGQVGV